MRPVICGGTWPGEQGIPLWVHRFEGLTFNRDDDSPQTLYDLDPLSVLSTRHLQRGKTIYACDLSDDDHRHLAARRHGVTCLGGVMSKPHVSLYDIQHAIRHLEAKGERASVRRVQRQMGRGDAGISRLMRTHGLTQTTMDRMVRGRRSGPRPRDYEAARRQKPRAGQRTRAQKPRTGQRVKRQKRPAGQLEPRHQRLERAQAPEPSIEPYLAFVTALLDQAIRDVGSRSHDCRRAAWHWLRAHPDCVEICEWLELDHARVIEVLERRGAGAA